MGWCCRAIVIASQTPSAAKAVPQCQSPYMQMQVMGLGGLANTQASNMSTSSTSCCQDADWGRSPQHPERVADDLSQVGDRVLWPLYTPLLCSSQAGDSEVTSYLLMHMFGV